MQRRYERSRVALGAHLRSVKTRLDLSLADISINGCRIVGVYDNLDPGQLVILRPEGLGEIGAAVIWHSDGSAGLEFDFPLRQEIVDCLSRIYPPDGAKLPAEVAA
jgi:hypothetical protein